MRAMWIAVSAFLLASGPAYAGDASPTRDDNPVLPHLMLEPSPSGKAQVTVTDQSPEISEHGLSTVAPDEAQGTTGVRQVPVTIDPAHPGGLFPWGG